MTSSWPLELVEFRDANDVTVAAWTGWAIPPLDWVLNNNAAAYCTVSVAGKRIACIMPGHDVGLAVFRALMRYEMYIKECPYAERPPRAENPEEPRKEP